MYDQDTLVALIAQLRDVIQDALNATSWDDARKILREGEMPKDTSDIVPILDGDLNPL